MKAKTVFVGVCADRIDLVVCQGDAVIASRRVQADIPQDSSAWTRHVEECRASLREAVQAMGIEGSAACVLYRGPTELVDFASVPGRIASEAKQAAILSITDALAYPTELAVCEAALMGRDADGAEPRAHYVVAADREDTVTVLAQLVEDAGLTFESATPIDAAVMARLGSETLPLKDACGVLYVGEQRSFFLVMSDGALSFARAVSIGIDAMITSLTRPMRTAAGAEPIELSRESAKQILYAHGFPDRQAVVESNLTLTGAQVIPLLQPVLQRFIIELRQSLRFGVPERHRESLSLTLTGPGSSIPNFASIVSEELRLAVSIDERYARFDAETPGCAGSELADAVAEHRTLADLALRPQHISAERQTNRLRRWLWTGAAAALAMIAAEAVQQRSVVATLREEAHGAKARSAGMQALQSTGQKLTEAVTAMTALNSAIHKETAATVDLRACLHDISRRTPSSIRLTSIAFITAGDRPGLRLRGYAFGERPELEPFISKLRDSALFSEVTLQNVVADTWNNLPSQRFEARLASVSAPRAALTRASSSSTAEAMHP